MNLFDTDGAGGVSAPPAGRATERQATRQTTSDEAYRLAEESSGVRDVILDLFKRRPMTCDEIVQIGFAHQSASAAINWLMRRGHIVPTGEKRKTSMGRKAIVWRYEPNPVPLTRTRPTRRELDRRIEQALSLLRTCLVMNDKHMLALRILEGKETLDA